MSSKKIPKEELYPNSTQFPNMLLDEVWPLLTPQEAMVLAVAVRKTLGWRKRQDIICLSQFCEVTGLGRYTVQKALHALKAVNLVIDLGYQVKKTDDGFSMGKAYTLNVWEELNHGPINVEMLRKRREERQRINQSRTKEGRKAAEKRRLSLSHRLKPVGQTTTKSVAHTKGKSVPHTTQNLIKPKKPKGGTKRHPDHQRLMALYRQAIREDEGMEKGKELSAPGKENKAASKILERGFTPEEVITCYRHFKAEPFWADKHLSLAYIAEHIGAWKESKRGRPEREKYRDVLENL